MFVILRDQGIVFLHIPKAAGSSIEFNLSGQELRYDQEPDYELGWGWCPERKIWMQHATAQQLVDLELINVDELREFFTFTVVRNPYARALSDFVFLTAHVGGRGTFQDMLNRSGAWSDILTNENVFTYRGDHLRPMCSYTSVDGEEMVNYVGRTEDMSSTYEVLENRLGRPLDRELRRKRGRVPFSHYSHFFSDREVGDVATAYEDDLDRFGYEFDDQRSALSRLARPVRRLEIKTNIVKGTVKREAFRFRNRLRDLRS